MTRLENMLEKGNVWYVRHYEAYFDEVYVVYLLGKVQKIIKQGNTTLISLGSGKAAWDLLLAPFRLLRFAQKIKPTSYLTADIIFSWWTSILVKLILRAKVFLMPVYIPETIYQVTGRNLLGLPRIVERIVVELSFLNANKVVTGYSFGNFVDWLSKNEWTKNKLIVVDKLVDALPTPEFFRNLREKKLKFVKLNNNDYVSLLYVGRLHREKMVDDLLKALKIMLESEPSKKFYLTIIGDGPEKDCLLKLSKALKIKDKVKFTGYVKNEDLVDYYLNADIYVSPLTGTSLREAALCGLPIVAYDTDWIRGILKHEENALLVPVGNIQDLAREAMRLAQNEYLKRKLIKNIEKLAWKMWDEANIRNDLSKIFESSQKIPPK